MSDTANWFFTHNGAQSGPVALAALRDLIRQGQVQSMDHVWREGMPQWQPAGQVPELFAPAANAPPPPPPPVYGAPGAAYPQQAVPLGYAGAPQPYVPDPNALGQNAGMRMILPVGRSGWAIAAGYLGLFAVIPIFAPLAIVASILAFRDMKKHPERHGLGRAIFGLVMGILFTIILVLFMIPSMLRR